MAQPMGDLLADPAKCRVCKQPCVARTKRGAVEHVGCAGWQDPPPQGVSQDPWGSLNVSALASKLGAVVISDEVEVRTPSRQDQSQNLVFGALCVVCGKICTTELHFDNRQVPVHEECLMARKEYKHPGALETELKPQDCPTCGETIWCGYFGGIEYRIDPVRLGTASLEAALAGDVPVVAIRETLRAKFVCSSLPSTIRQQTAVRMHACYLDTWFGRRKHDVRSIRADYFGIYGKSQMEADPVWDALW